MPTQVAGQRHIKGKQKNLRDNKCRKKAFDAFKYLKQIAKQMVKIQLSLFYTTEGRLLPPNTRGFQHSQCEHYGLHLDVAEEWAIARTQLDP